MDVLIHIRDYDEKIKDDNLIGDFNIFSEIKIINIFKKHNYKTFIQEYFPKKKLVKKTLRIEGVTQSKQNLIKTQLFLDLFIYPGNLYLQKESKKEIKYI